MGETDVLKQEEYGSIYCHFCYSSKQWLHIVIVITFMALGVSLVGRNLTESYAKVDMQVPHSPSRGPIYIPLSLEEKELGVFDLYTALYGEVQIHL